MSEKPILAGKRCLVTGGARNLGRSICLALARRGARVAFTYRNSEEEAAETAQALAGIVGSEAPKFRGSVADPTHAPAVIKELVGQWGGLDVLVNNASVFHTLPFPLIDEGDWDAVMDACAKGPYLFARAALRPMMRQRSGHILNIGAFSEGRSAVQLPAHFAAAKAALHGFTRALAHEVGRRGIQVNYLAPGLLDKGLARRLPDSRVEEYIAHCATGRLATTEEIANIATWLVSSDNSLMSAANILADGGVLA